MVEKSPNVKSVSEHNTILCWSPGTSACAPSVNTASVSGIRIACELAPSEGGKKFGEQREWESERKSPSEASGTQAPSEGGEKFGEQSECESERGVQLALDYTRLARPKPNREPIRRPASASIRTSFPVSLLFSYLSRSKGQEEGRPWERGLQASTKYWPFGNKSGLIVSLEDLWVCCFVGLVRDKQSHAVSPQSAIKDVINKVCLDELSVFHPSSYRQAQLLLKFQVV